jgi:hypothetical protein
MKTTLTRQSTVVTKAIRIVLLAVAASGCTAVRVHDHDVLAITEARDDSVRFFDAKTGRLFDRPAVAPGSGGLKGPRGILFNARRAEWLVVNQNVGTDLNGEVFRYDRNGAFLGALVPRTDPNGPFAPRGIALVRNKEGARILFIADLVSGDGGPGKLLAYRVKGNRATFIANLDPNLKKPGSTEAFHPRGVVLGPDGYLYVSLRNLSACGGSILRFDPQKLAFKDTLLSNPVECARNINDLHRPEGLVFSPDGDLYITSFQKDPSDTDKVLIIPRRERRTGNIHLPLDRIDFYRVGEPRRFAQAVLFGPEGQLFVPLSDNLDPSLSNGEVRRYNVKTKAYSTFVAQGRGVNAPQFLSFRKTDPATLEYDSDAYRGRDRERGD